MANPNNIQREKAPRISWDSFVATVQHYVADYTNKVLGLTGDDCITDREVYVCSMCKELQNWKGTFGTPMMDGRYFEATLNGDVGEIYVDSYVKEDNTALLLNIHA